MKFIPANLPEKAYYKPTYNLKLLDSFIESGLPCAKVEEYTHKDAYCCASSIKGAIKRFKLHNIECRTINREVYLINTAAR